MRGRVDGWAFGDAGGLGLGFEDGLSIGRSSSGLWTTRCGSSCLRGSVVWILFSQCIIHGFIVVILVLGHTLFVWGPQNTWLHGIRGIGLSIGRIHGVDILSILAWIWVASRAWSSLDASQGHGSVVVTQMIVSQRNSRTSFMWKGTFLFEIHMVCLMM